MLKVKVITIGKCKESWLKLALQEYEKRLSQSVSILWVEVKQNEQLREQLKEEPFIALDPTGELLDSPALSRKFSQLFIDLKSRLTFAIGGPEGFPPDLLAKAFWTWSLSPLTFTHQTARLLLIEQLYRSFEIARGSSYHK